MTTATPRGGCRRRCSWLLPAIAVAIAALCCCAPTARAASFTIDPTISLSASRSGPANTSLDSNGTASRVVRTDAELVQALAASHPQSSAPLLRAPPAAAAGGLAGMAPH
jgi:hypothetical protein